jgi:pyridoxamine 5'-phosphate oxidase
MLARRLCGVDADHPDAEPGQPSMVDPPESFDPGGAERDPIERFRRWADQARGAGSVMADTAILATASPDRVPSARAVILRGLDSRGFVFFTNYESPKARALEANPLATLVFVWPELHRQVRVVGAVERVSKEESEAYFRTRPPGHRLAAWASPQSKVIGSRRELEQAFEQARSRFTRSEISLPPFWGGFRVIPDTIEFWEGRENRLHDRVRYTRRPDAWTIERLAP